MGPERSEEKEHVVGTGKRRRRDERQEQDRTKRPGRDWRLVISGLAGLISLASLAVSIAALSLTRRDVWNANRARRERAEYLSYRLGVDLGIYTGASQYEGMPSLAFRVTLARDSFRTSLRAIGGDLGLAIEIPESLNTASARAEVLRIKMRIRDTCGQRSVESYALGADLGQAIGMLLPWKVDAEAGHSSPTMPGATFDQVAELTRIVNKQLGILGFPQRVQLDDKVGARSFDRLNELDRALIGAWDPREGRWRRPTQAVSPKESGG